MSESDALGEELRAAITRFLVPLRTEKTIDQTAFDKLEQCAKRLSVNLKEHDLVSKALLRELYIAAGSIRAEAPYVAGETSRLEKMAGQIQLIFDLIIFGESYDDLTPGIARVR